MSCACVAFRSQWRSVCTVELSKALKLAYERYRLGDYALRAPLLTDLTARHPL